MAKKPIEVLKQMTLAEMRQMYTEQFQKLRAGETTPANTNAFANLGGKYLQSIKLELEAVKMLGGTPTQIQRLISSATNDEPESGEGGAAASVTAIGPQRRPPSTATGS